MIDPDKRKPCICCTRKGWRAGDLPALNLSRNTVRRIIGQQGMPASAPRKDKVHIDRELLERLYQECERRIQRVHEKLLRGGGHPGQLFDVDASAAELGISRLRRSVAIGCRTSRARRCSTTPVRIW